MAVIGSGNIGTDLMIKVLRLVRAPCEMARDGRHRPGLRRPGPRRAGSGVATTAEGVDGLIALPEFADDRASSSTPPRPAPTVANAAVLRAARQAAGRPDARPPSARTWCPPVNLDEHLDAPQRQHGDLRRPGHHPDRRRGRAGSPRCRTPRSSPRSPRSRPAPAPGPTSTSSPRPRRAAIEAVGGADRGKAIIVLNPAEPPLIMRDTVFCLIDDADARRGRAPRSTAMVAEVADVRPRLPAQAGGAVRPRSADDEPVHTLLPDGAPGRPAKVTVFLEVEGAAHYLPAYAGNLDIMTSAALRVARAASPRTRCHGGGRDDRAALHPGRHPARRHARHPAPHTPSTQVAHASPPRWTPPASTPSRSPTATAWPAAASTTAPARTPTGSGSRPPRRRRRPRQADHPAAARHRHHRTTCKRAHDLGVPLGARRHPLHRGRHLRPAHRHRPRARHGRRPAS